MQDCATKTQQQDTGLVVVYVQETGLAVVYVSISVVVYVYIIAVGHILIQKAPMVPTWDLSMSTIKLCAGRSGGGERWRTCAMESYRQGFLTSRQARIRDRQREQS